jgi:hypothetical protein
MLSRQPGFSRQLGNGTKHNLTLGARRTVTSFRKIAILAILLAGRLMSGHSGQPLSSRENETLGGTALGAGAGAILGAAVARLARALLSAVCSQERRALHLATRYRIGK